MKKSFLERIKQCNQLKHKEHQDLYWLLTSDSLSEKLIPEKHFSLIDENLINQLFEDFINATSPNIYKPNLRLGKYVEQLIAYYLNQFSPVKLLANQIQLIDKKITVGEIDFILKSNHEFIHLEFAVKYYLEITTNNKEYWGANFNDNWARKKEHFITKQLKLPAKYKELLPIELRSYSFKNKVSVLGNIFNKLIENEIQWYCHFTEIDLLFHTGSYYKILNKRLDWVFPFRESTNILSLEKLKNINQDDGPKMVVIFNQKKIPISWGFILFKNTSINSE